MHRQRSPVAGSAPPSHKSFSRQLQRPVRRTPRQHKQQQKQLPLLPPSSLHPDLAQLVQQRQQHQPDGQEPLLPHLLCELAPAALMGRVKKCRSWHDAAVLFAQQAPCLNHINLSALLVKLAHLPGPPSSRPANWQPFVCQVLAASQPLLQLAEPRHLSNMAWALAKLGLHDWADIGINPAGTAPGSSSSSSSSSSSHMPHALPGSSAHSAVDGSGSDSIGSAKSWGCVWQQRVLHSLPTASCRDVSNILWALATSSQQQHDLHCQQQQAATTSQTGSQQQQQQQQRVALLGRSRLVQELLSALHRTLPDSAPQDVANAVWALAVLRVRTSPELLSFSLVRLQRHFDALAPAEVAMSLWGLAQLQAAPPSSWLEECLLRQVGRQRWQHTQPRHWVMPLAACAHLKQVPPTPWLTQCLQKLQQHMLAAVAQQQDAAQQSEEQQQQQREQEQQQLLSACDQQAADTVDWPHQLFAAAAAAHGGQGSDSIQSNSISSTGTGISTDSSNSRRRRRSSNSSSSSGDAEDSHTLSTQDLSNTLWALAKLRVKPNPEWMMLYMAASAASLAAASPQELVNTVWGLQVLGVAPSAAWLAAFDAASMAHMDSFTPQGLADALASQVRLGLRPSCAWCEAWAAALKASWGSMDAPAVCKSLWAAAKCQLPLGRAWLREALQRVHQPLLLPALATGGLTVEEMLRLVWAVGRLCRGNLSQELSNLLGLYCCRAAGKMSGAQLARGAWGLARLVPLPRDGLLSYYHDLAAAKVKYLPEQEGAALQHRLALLKDAAAKAELLGTNWRVVLREAAARQYDESTQHMHAAATTVVVLPPAAGDAAMVGAVRQALGVEVGRC